MDLTIRELKPALKRGLRNRCPNCGEGRILSGYLKVASECTVCGQSFTAQRADDGPAYLTVLIGCHVGGFLLHGLFVHTDLSPLQNATITGSVVTLVSLALLPRFKGAMIAWQWASRLHGF
ncbi:MAG: hypothetical protein JG765_2335 [Cereibacter sp.]|jgi:uncharacterized protein (DUF983 family)|nr:hypothetical protein [Cereibacter sp.]